MIQNDGTFFLEHGDGGNNFQVFGLIITHNWMVLLVIAWSLDIWMIHETPVALYNVIS